MKYSLTLLLVSLFSLNSYADETEQPKMLQVGFGTYAISIAYDESGWVDDELSGITFAVRGTPTNNFAIHANFYDTDHDDFSAINNTGTDIVVYFGNNLQSKGLKLYAGAGIFKETWELIGYKFDFSGFQLSGGIGHNWDNFAIDFILSLRDPSDYEDENVGGSVTASAASGSLQVSARF